MTTQGPVRNGWPSLANASPPSGPDKTANCAISAAGPRSSPDRETHDARTPTCSCKVSSFVKSQHRPSSVADRQYVFQSAQTMKAAQSLSNNPRCQGIVSPHKTDQSHQMIKGKCHCDAVSWTMKHMPDSATLCNCTICRRYGVIWAYGYIDDDIHSVGETTTYRRADGGAIDFHFCANCSCVTHYVRTAVAENGRHRTAVNLRLCDPEPIWDLPIVPFDGLETLEDLPPDGRRVRDMWF